MADQPLPEDADPILDAHEQGLEVLQHTLHAFAGGQLRAFALVGVDDRGRAVGTIYSHDRDLQVISDVLVKQSKTLLLAGAMWDHTAPPNNRSTSTN